MLKKSRRPDCVNYGCGKPAMKLYENKDGASRYRPHCSHCQKASYGGHPHARGVTPFKTGKCSNTDSHLGFKCPIDWNAIPTDAKGMTEIDHRDGNSNNNDRRNLDELCPICHKIKGQLNFDYDRTRIR
jgi:hypothetical protein